MPPSLASFLKPIHFTILFYAIAQASIITTFSVLLLFIGYQPLYGSQNAGKESWPERWKRFSVYIAIVFIEELVALQHTPMNTRVVTSCVAGLLEGPGFGFGIGCCAVLLAKLFQAGSPAGLGINMLLGGLLGGAIQRYQPLWAKRPLTGFVIGTLASWARYPIAWGLHQLVSSMPAPPLSIVVETCTALINGFGVALLLFVIATIQYQKLQAQSAANLEVRALLARMNPHFLYNALNTISALSKIAPEKVPQAIERLAFFLRSCAFWEKDLVSLYDEIQVVEAYLDIEKLRFGERLKISWEVTVDPKTVLVPPFLLQPIVENAVQHGLQNKKDAGGLVSIKVFREHQKLTIQVEDTGIGIPPIRLKQLFSSDIHPPHALSTLQRRLEVLYGKKGQIDVRSTPNNGTYVKICIPIATDESELSP
ncbi:putative regulator of cell autolysis [Chthonomonas calidirosea]|uniref:sensor histidine kinase n=1 Tax=Chthonomonas calidirosea TaxID=454171 RepID=UPI0006DD463D|nr:sensor histidine kinase [Chthonomonas calidirosea]CEK16577.1 putative regulator of cell autolysis [Chthonomonas calidirosea]